MRTYNIKRILFILLIISVFCACDMFESNPFDGRISGETNINAKNISKIETACAGKSAIRFVLVSDTQRWYDETEDFVRAINKRNDIDFVFHAGDVSDFGATKEFMWQRDILNKLKMPYVVALGNHDCLATGLFVYKKIFGAPDFSFVAGDTKFICLNTNALEFDYSIPVPDFSFIKNEWQQESDYRKTVIVMHAPPFSEQFNNNVANAFQAAIKQLPRLQFCLYGHIHTIKSDDLFDDGIMYYSVSNIEKRKYLIFTLKADDTYDYEVAEF